MKYAGTGCWCNCLITSIIQQDRFDSLTWVAVCRTLPLVRQFLRGVFWRRFRVRRMNRRQFIRSALGWSALSTCMVANGAAISLHCTPAPSFPVPLREGIWRSQKFPVGKHDYHVWLNVDRRVPLEELDCDLGTPRSGYQCNALPLLDLEWWIWDGTTLVKNWPAKPIKADAWSETSTSCLLGDFKGKRNGYFILELNVKKDAGRLKDLHPHVQIVKNPGYWCWL